MTKIISAIICITVEPNLYLKWHVTPIIVTKDTNTDMQQYITIEWQHIFIYYNSLMIVRMERIM
jgi:hypothetical protein